MKSIKLKFMVIVSVIMVIFLVIQSSIILNITKKQLKDEAKKDIYAITHHVEELLKEIEASIALIENQSLSSYDKNIKNQVENAKSVLNHFYNQYRNGVLTEKEAKRIAVEIIRNMTYGTDGYFWIDDTNYKLILLPPNPENEGMDRGNLKDAKGKRMVRELVDGAKRNGETFVDYYFPKPGETEAVRKRGHVQLFEPWQWVIGTGNYIDDIDKHIASYTTKLKEEFGKKISDLSGNGDIGVFDAEGKMFYHSNKEIIGQNLNIYDTTNREEISRMLLSTKNDYVEFTSKDKTGEKIKKIGYVLYDHESRRYIVTALNSNNVFAGVIRTSRIIYGLIIGAIIFTLIASFIIAQYFTNPIVLVANFANEIAGGNLVIKSLETKSKDEIGSMVKSLNEMHKNLKIMIGQIREVVQKVVASSQELVSTGTQVGEAASQVGSAIEQVAAGAEEQASQVEETANQISFLIEQVGLVNERSTQMSDAGGRVADQVALGTDSVTSSVKQMRIIKNQVVGAAKVVKDLGGKSEDVGNIVGLINGISNQTNLLALNAAIEAARAGEVGRGFAVVADEIRSLAEETSNATSRIGNLIEEIQVEISEVVKTMDEVNQQVEKGSDVIEDTGEVFEQIKDVIRSLFEQINQVTQSTQNMTVSSNEAERAIQDIAAVSEEFASSSEEVAASSEEQNAATEEIVSFAKQLARMADELERTVEKFKL